MPEFPEEEIADSMMTPCENSEEKVFSKAENNKKRVRFADLPAKHVAARMPLKRVRDVERALILKVLFIIIHPSKPFNIPYITIERIKNAARECSDNVFF